MLCILCVCVCLCECVCVCVCVRKSPKLSLLFGFMNMYQPLSKFSLCGDFKGNYWSHNTLKYQISVLLQSCNLAHTCDFHTTIRQSTSTAIDNIFIVYTRIKFFGYNDTKHLILNNVFTTKKVPALYTEPTHLTKSYLRQFYRLQLLRQENIHEQVDINKTFNLYLNTFFIIF